MVGTFIFTPLSSLLTSVSTSEPRVPPNSVGSAPDAAFERGDDDQHRPLALSDEIAAACAENGDAGQSGHERSALNGSEHRNRLPTDAQSSA